MTTNESRHHYDDVAASCIVYYIAFTIFIIDPIVYITSCIHLSKIFNDDYSRRRSLLVLALDIDLYYLLVLALVIIPFRNLDLNSHPPSAEDSRTLCSLTHGCP